MKTLLAAGTFLAAALAFAPLAGAQAKLEPIGSAVFEIKPQKAVIEVGRKAGGFSAIRIDVKQSDVQILDLKVVYGNGTFEDIKVRQLFKAGSASRLIDLKGGSRLLQQVIVTFVPTGPAKIDVLGVPAVMTPKWEQLGCKTVDFKVDRDTLQVGRKEGQFAAIKLRVKDAPIEFYDLRVVFGNGSRQEYRVRAVVPAGGESRMIDLPGDMRGIDRIDMLYRSIPTFKGKAAVCVDALPR